MIGRSILVATAAMTLSANAFGDAAVDAAVQACVPGSRITECSQAVAAAGQDGTVAHKGDLHRLGIKLPSPFLGLSVWADDNDPLIKRVEVYAERKPGKERRALVEWFTKRLKPSIEGDGFCGAGNSGPAWGTANDTHMSVALALTQVDELRAGLGKNLEKYFTMANSPKIEICFYADSESLGAKTLSAFSKDFFAPATISTHSK